MKAYDIFTPDVLVHLHSIIAEAERRTSGEIRLHIEDECGLDPLARAEYIFGSLKMQETKDRNAVLVYISIVDRKFALFGDIGIHEKVGAEYWNKTLQLAIEELHANHIAQGIGKAILSIGDQLSHYFPLEKNDKNELSNEITFGNSQTKTEL